MWRLCLLLLIGICPVLGVAQSPLQDEARDMCRKISQKLASVSYGECAGLSFKAPRFYSVDGQAILETHFPADPAAADPLRILFISGIHGDEFSSVSVTFKWLNMLQQQHRGDHEWLFLPLANPDGMLRRKGQRVNANQVDLNRNFMPTAEGHAPLDYWKTQARQRARYYPGLAPLSEPESRAIHQLIDEFRPRVIVSVHAPHGILDHDGLQQPPQKLGPLQLRRLGTYPGSLGNYGWFVRNIPVLTIELASAGAMPSAREIWQMWADLNGWIARESAPRLQMAGEAYSASASNRSARAAR